MDSCFPKNITFEILFIKIKKNDENKTYNTILKYNLNIMDSGFPKNITFEIFIFFRMERIL